jgi:hypothetical protein
VVHLQYWPVSAQPIGRALESVKPYYTSGDYFAKSEDGALNRAWDNLYSRYCLLAGCEDQLASPGKAKPSGSSNLGKAPSCITCGKASLRTEITTLSQA